MSKKYCEELMKIGLLRESIGHIIINPIIYFSNTKFTKELHIFVYRKNQLKNLAAFEIMRDSLSKEFRIIFIDSNFLFSLIYNIFYRTQILKWLKDLIFIDIHNIHHNPYYEKKYNVKFKTWTKNPISLKFSIPQKFEIAFQEWKVKNGLQENYICVFARDSLYHKDSYTDIRNTDFKTLIPTIIYLLNNGYQVVRMGRNHSHDGWVESILNPYKKNFKYFDYDQIYAKNDSVDILLLNYCKFFISNNSGILMPCYFFNTPLIIYDWVPAGIQPYYSKQSVYILKDYYQNCSLKKYEEIPDTIKIIEDEKILSQSGYHVKSISPNNLLAYVQRSIKSNLSDTIKPPMHAILYGGETEIDRLWYEERIADFPQ